MSVSSDEPYEQWYGDEILLHGPNNVDLSRIQQNAAPLLRNHDPNQFLGKVANPRLKDGKLYVDLKFSQSEDAMRTLADLRDGLATEMSIGYQVNKYEVDEERETYTATSWQIYEISTVSVPADFSVGVGRSAQPVLTTRQMNTTTTDPNETKPNQRTASQERERINAIRSAAKLPTVRRFVSESDVERAINEDWSKKAFQEFVLQAIGNSPESIVTASDDPHNGNRDRTLGEMIVNHPEARRFLSGAGQRNASFELKGVRAIRQLQRRASFMVGTDSVGPAVQRLPNIQGVALEHLVVADLLAQAVTDAGVVLYPRENSWVTQAGFVAEMTLKPTQVFDLQPASAAVKKIAAIAKVSDELFQDTPGAVSYINTRLLFSVQKSEDNALLNGSGVGAEIQGIRTTAGLQTLAVSTTALDAIRSAIAQVEVTTDFHVSGIVVHPQNWSNIELLKDSNNRYLVAPGPNPRRVWNSQSGAESVG